MLIRVVKSASGNIEIALYHDADGYHCERWDERKQMVVDIGSDCETEIDAFAAINACPKCGGDTMICECVTEHSQA